MNSFSIYLLFKINPIPVIIYYKLIINQKMLKNIKNQIQLAAIIAPVYADSLQITPENNSSFGNLKSLTAQGIISGAIGLVLLVVALVFFFILVIGGLKWVTSGGDEKKVGAARAQITNALIGLAIVFAAWAIMRLIGTVFGIDILGNLTIPTFR
jgi:hypothetical protein